MSVTVRVPDEQVRAMNEKILGAWAALKRQEFEPIRLECPWWVERLLFSMTNLVVSPARAALYGCSIEWHEAPTCRMVGKSGDVHRAIDIPLDASEEVV